MPVAILCVVIQLVSAAIFTAISEGPMTNYGNALYHCIITATTVGYGDIAVNTQSARLFASFHILISVSWLAAFVSDIENLRAVRKAQLQRLALLTRTLDQEQIFALDRDGKGVDKLEFVVGMLIMLGVEMCGARPHAPRRPVTSRHSALHHVTLHPVPSHPIASHAIPFRPITARPIPSHPIPSRPIPSYPILSHPIPSNQLLSCHVALFAPQARSLRGTTYSPSSLSLRSATSRTRVGLQRKTSRSLWPNKTVHNVEGQRVRSNRESTLCQSNSLPEATRSELSHRLESPFNCWHAHRAQQEIASQSAPAGTEQQRIDCNFTCRAHEDEHYAMR